ncbi:tRNA lysidine(34) synthetase TilS [bacterium]|nr:MAG: tRNA lysidine(34) synthetase TilS [bacterium]
MRKYVLAVSGGVDSMVLLHALHAKSLIAGVDPWKLLKQGELIVAHFDHGIRPDSADDAAFVVATAEDLGIPVYTKREELGANASEEHARDRRYRFLKSIAVQYDARIVTAHHEGDIGETIAINLTRGTGWRGVAVLDAPDIDRPLLSLSKQEIVSYATVNNVQWHEDSTNSNTRYLRNALRQKLSAHQDILRQLAALRSQQIQLKQLIEQEIVALDLGDLEISRYFLSHCGDPVAIEILRAICLRYGSSGLTIPQRQRLLHSIKVAKQGTTINAGDGVNIRFSRTGFVVVKA